MAQQQREVNYSSAKEIVYVLFCYKWMILSVFLLVSTVVTVVTYLWPPAFESDARLLIRLGRQSLSGDPSMSNTMVNATQDRTNEVKSILAILSSRNLAEEVVATLGEPYVLDALGVPPTVPGVPADTTVPAAGSCSAGPPAGSQFRKLLDASYTLAEGLLVKLKLREHLEPHEKAVEEVMTKLKVDVEKQTNIVNLRYEAEYPKQAQNILATLLDKYDAQHIRVFAAQEKPEFFQDRVKTLFAALSECESELEAFKKAYNIIDLKKQKENLIDQIGMQEAQYAEAQSGKAGLEARVAELKATVERASKQHETSRVVGRPNFAVDAMHERLIGLEIEESDMAARYPATHRPLQFIRAQLKVLREEIAKQPPTLTEITTGLNANRESWKNSEENERSQLAFRAAQEKAIGQEVTRLKEELASLTSHEADFMRLQRERDLAEAEYKAQLENFQRADLSARMDKDKMTNVSRVQPASLPFEPISPKKLRNIALGLACGLFGGLALAFLLQYMNESLNTVEDVERRLGVPVLASVSEKAYKSIR